MRCQELLNHFQKDFTIIKSGLSDFALGVLNPLCLGSFFHNLYIGQDGVSKFINHYCLESVEEFVNYLKCNALEQLANILLFQEKYKEAIEILDPQKVNVFFPHKYLDLGIASQGLGNYDDACQFYCQFIETEQEKQIYLPYYYRGITFYKEGTLYLQLGLEQEALNDFNQCIELNQNFAEAYLERGLLLKDENQAKIDLEKAVSLCNNNPYYLIRLGVFEYTHYHVEEALDILKQVNTLWLEKGQTFFEQLFFLTQKQIQFITEYLNKFQPQFRGEKRRSLSIQPSNVIRKQLNEQQRQITQLQQQVKNLNQEQRKIKKSLSPMKKKQQQIEKQQKVFEKILENEVIIRNNWERLRKVGNECERLYCQCLFWKLSSFIHACIQANTKIFQTNAQEFKPNNTQLMNFFIESSISLLKIIGYVPTIGAVATIIAETLQDINESSKKTSFREKIEKIALVVQSSSIGLKIDEQIQLATFLMGSKLIERQFFWKTKKPRFFKQVEKMAQIEKQQGNQEACRLEYLQGIEDCLYILQYIVDDCKVFLEEEISLKDVILYIFNTKIYQV